MLTYSLWILGQFWRYLATKDVTAVLRSSFDGAVSSWMAIWRWVRVRASSESSSSSSAQWPPGSAMTEGWRVSESARLKKGHAMSRARLSGGLYSIYFGGFSGAISGLYILTIPLLNANQSVNVYLIKYAYAFHCII